MWSLWKLNFSNINIFVKVQVDIVVLNNIEVTLLATTFHLAIVNEMLTLPCNYCYETCFYKLISFSQSSLVISFDFLNQKEITDNTTRYWSVLLTFLSHNLIFISLYSNYMRKRDVTYPKGPPNPHLAIFYHVKCVQMSQNFPTIFICTSISQNINYQPEL